MQYFLFKASENKTYAKIRRQLSNFCLSRNCRDAIGRILKGHNKNFFFCYFASHSWCYAHKWNLPNITWAIIITHLTVSIYDVSLFCKVIFNIVILYFQILWFSKSFMRSVCKIFFHRSNVISLEYFQINSII